MKTRQQRFREKLEVKKGKEFVRYMDRLTNTNETITMKDVADKYQMTRERVRQIFLKLHGYPFTEVKKRRAERRAYLAPSKIAALQAERNKLHNRLSRYKEGTKIYRSLLSEIEFSQRCENLGLKVHAHPGRSRCDFIVNGKHVDVKRCEGKIFMRGTKTGMYRFATRPTQYCVTDFYAVHIADINIFFIIPKSAIPATESFKTNPNNYCFYFTSEKTNYCNSKNRYLEFRDAWHLLNGNGAAQAAANTALAESVEETPVNARPTEHMSQKDAITGRVSAGTGTC